MAKGLQCEKALWLLKHKKSVLTPPDIMQQALFDQGHEVGKVAQELYPGGTLVPFDMSPFNAKFDYTQSLINDGVTTIYEASFKTQHLMCIVDILHKGPDGWELIEVKSTTSDKEVVLDDIAIQYFILTQVGFPIAKTNLMHINRDYVRGKSLEIADLFKHLDVTADTLERQEKLKTEYQRLVSVITDYNEPEKPLGQYCLSPYTCDAKAYCWANIPAYSIFNLAGMKLDQKFEWYNKGVLTLDQMPETAQITENQTLQINSSLTGEKKINLVEINRFMQSIHYPIAYLDFESFQGAIPPFEGSRPYQQLPFQHSIHIMNSPFDQPSHFEYLGDPKTDPRKDLAKDLCNKIPKDACVLVYNAAFEKSIIKELADLYPKYEEKLMKIHDNIVDLMLPFKEKWVYYPEMKGSYSIKAVLPALVPELSYENLEINNGAIASHTYSQMRKHPDNPENKNTIAHLLSYCELDTLAMVKLFEKLTQLTNES
ncbi:MAG: DUF2779 domain-containing protein [bacterium]|nr:DUF2779 domain-containing protein [bacterium]